MILDGKQIATAMIVALKEKSKPEKYFAVILAGDDPASLSFIRQKEKVAKELRIDFRLYKFPADIKNDELRNEVRKISEHTTCGGAIFQLPAPANVNRHYILNVIPREKDVDVLGERALGAFYAGRNPVIPPTVGTVQKIIEIKNLDIASMHVAVVGLGFLVGKPIATWLTGKTKELSLLHEGSDLETLKHADLVILGTGVAGLIKPEMLKDGAGVIDFGYARSADNKISGDFDANQLPIINYQLLGFYTPTPGGTGPILVAKLFENFYALNPRE